MKIIQQILSKHQSILKLYLAFIAAASSYDLIAFNTPIGNLKIAFILCIPLIILINYNEILNFILANKIIILGLVASLMISLFYSHDILSSLKWCLQLFMDIYLFITFYSGFKIIKDKVDLFRIILLLILLPGLIQWTFIQFSLVPPLLSQTHGIYYRLNGFSFYPNFFTVAISLFFPLILLNEKYSKMDYLIIFLSAFTLLQSTSRTGMLALILLILAKILIPFKWEKYKLIQLTPIMAAIFISMVIPEKTINNTKTFGLEKAAFFAKEMKLGPAVSPLERIYIAKQGIKVFTDYPFFGVGPNAYEKFINLNPIINYKKYFSETMRNNLYESHENIWIELLSGNGLVFTSILIIFLFLQFYKKTYRVGLQLNAIFSLSFYYLINGQFVQNILYPSTFVIWAILSYSKSYEN
jgi:hypothetical protein